MKNTLRSLLALTLSAACLASPSQAQASPESEQRARQEQETIQTRYLPDAQKAISAYFNTLGLKPEQIKEGLTIPWVSMTPRKGWFNREFVHTANGFAVATGKTASNGCPEFQIVAFNNNTRETYRSDAKFGICP